MLVLINQLVKSVAVMNKTADSIGYIDAVCLSHMYVTKSYNYRNYLVGVDEVILGGEAYGCSKKLQNEIIEFKNEVIIFTRGRSSLPSFSSAYAHENYNILVFAFICHWMYQSYSMSLILRMNCYIQDKKTVKIYIDGVLCKTFSLGGSPSKTRNISFSHIRSRIETLMKINEMEQGDLESYLDLLE